jgi:hypothetical protein
VTMAAMPVTIQAYVPQVVQTYSYAQAYGVVPSGMAYGAAAYPAYGAPANDAAVRALADLIANANTGNAAARTANFANTPASSDANRLPALEAKVQEIDARLSSLERRIDALCKTK